MQLRGLNLMSSTAVCKGLHLSEATIMLSHIYAWLRRVYSVRRTHGSLQLNGPNWIIRDGKLATIALLRADSLLRLDAF